MRSAGAQNIKIMTKQDKAIFGIDDNNGSVPGIDATKLVTTPGDISNQSAENPSAENNDGAVSPQRYRADVPGTDARKLISDQETKPVSRLVTVPGAQARIISNDKTPPRLVGAKGVDAWRQAAKPAIIPPAQAAHPSSSESDSAVKPEEREVVTIWPDRKKQVDGGNDSGTGNETSAQKATQITTVIPEEFKGSTNKELIEYLENRIAEHQPLSKDDLEKLRRRQKTEERISGISDAVRAVANLLFTHHYAPNMYDPSNSMSAKTKARFDKEKAERDADNEKYFNYALRLAQLKGADQAQAFDIWKTEQDLARSERAYEAAKARSEQEAAQSELNRLYKEGLISKQKYEIESAKAEADYKGAYWKSRVDVNESQKNKNDRYVPTHGRSGSGKSGARRGGRSGSKDYTQTVTKTGKDQYGRPVNTTTTTTRHYGSTSGQKKPTGLTYEK